MSLLGKFLSMHRYAGKYNKSRFYCVTNRKIIRQSNSKNAKWQFPVLLLTYLNTTVLRVKIILSDLFRSNVTKIWYVFTNEVNRFKSIYRYIKYGKLSWKLDACIKLMLEFIIVKLKIPYICTIRSFFFIKQHGCDFVLELISSNQLNELYHMTF